MKQLICVLAIFCLISCSKEIQDGPRIYLANDSTIADTIVPNQIIEFHITAIGQNAPITRIQAFVNTTEYFDSSFVPEKTIQVVWPMNFAGKLRTQNIVLQATDENDLITKQSKTIFIQE